jgi:hypothetical protein
MNLAPSSFSKIRFTTFGKALFSSPFPSFIPNVYSFLSDRAAELCIMFNCLYMSIWATNMISVVEEAAYSDFWDGLVQFFMILPFLWGFFCISFVAETCSLIVAMTDLNLLVVHDVLVQMELTDSIVREVKVQFGLLYQNDAHRFSPEEYVHHLFLEIDADGSGFIDPDELRLLMKKLHLTFSNYRFKLLYRRMDSCLRGQISEKQFKDFIFNQDDVEAGRASRKSSSTSAAPHHVNQQPKMSLVSNDRRTPFGLSTNSNNQANNSNNTENNNNNIHRSSVHSVHEVHPMQILEEENEEEEDDEDEEQENKNDLDASKSSVVGHSLQSFPLDSENDLEMEEC